MFNFFINTSFHHKFNILWCIFVLTPLKIEFATNAEYYDTAEFTEFSEDSLSCKAVEKWYIVSIFGVCVIFVLLTNQKSVKKKTCLSKEIDVLRFLTRHLNHCFTWNYNYVLPILYQTQTRRNLKSQFTCYINL